MNADKESTVLLLDQPEIERLMKAAGSRIFSAPGASQEMRFTRAQQDFFSAAVTITAMHLAKNVVACFDQMELRIAELEKQVEALGGGSGEKL